MATFQAGIAQLVARRSHSPEKKSNSAAGGGKASGFDNHHKAKGCKEFLLEAEQDYRQEVARANLGRENCVRFTPVRTGA